MIGIVAKANERVAVEEFFQLFKTAWEYCREGQSYDVVITTEDTEAEKNAKLVIRFSEMAGRHRAMLEMGELCIPLYRSSTAAVTVDRRRRGEGTRVCLSYNLWAEIEYLLRVGQPVDQAQVPTLELHIQFLRELILKCETTLVEIRPVPAGYEFAVTLTHDIDFIGIRQHRFDHTLAGFLFRSTFGALRDCWRGRISSLRLLRIWKAVASLPFVYLGLAKDFWLPFDWYLNVERQLPATYYFIPFKHRAGEKVYAQNPHRRGCAYDIGDIPQWVAVLQRNGCEIGVHGIDAWHSVEKARTELARVAAVSGSTTRGIRMHWLLQDSSTPGVLEEAGYDYDSSVGYNETIGYRAGTTQVYLPFGNRTLLELPMHIQDGALFYPQKLGLAEKEAWELCEKLAAQARRIGGVLTVLWHDRSHGPERFWGEFYARLVGRLRQMNVWFASGAQVVRWFRARREVTFKRSASGIEISRGGEQLDVPFSIRVYHGGETSTHEDTPWAGVGRLELGELIGKNGPVELAMPA